MSGSLLEIRKKIGSVKNTRKITKAMQLVAASKMRQFQKRALSVRDYVRELLAVLNLNLSDGEQGESVFTVAPERATRSLFVLYTSDKGLCGPLNNKLINGLFRSDRWQEVPSAERRLITIGKKSHDYARNQNIPVLKNFSGLPEKISSLDALTIIDFIIAVWQEGETKEVVFVAPHYKNSFTFYPVLKTFLPFGPKTIAETLGVQEAGPSVSQNAGGGYMLFEPSEQVVKDRLYQQLLQVLFLQSFLELKASEYSSRMIAMQNATDAADRITADLTRDYNKARQAVITREIAELMGASMALEK